MYMNRRDIKAAASFKVSVTSTFSASVKFY